MRLRRPRRGHARAAARCRRPPSLTRHAAGLPRRPPAAQQGDALPADPPTIGRSSPSCATPATASTAAGCAADRRAVARRPADPRGARFAEADLDRRRGSLLCGAARAGVAARSPSTTGHGNSSRPGSGARRAPGRTTVCVATRPRVGGRGPPLPPARAPTRRREAGVRRRFAPHQLRHAHAVEMAREGVPLIVIQRQLGHTNLGITSDLPTGHRQHRIIDTVHARRPAIPRRQRRTGTAAIGRMVGLNRLLGDATFVVATAPCLTGLWVPFFGGHAWLCGGAVRDAFMDGQARVWRQGEPMSIRSRRRRRLWGRCSAPRSLPLRGWASPTRTTSEQPRRVCGRGGRAHAARTRRSEWNDATDRRSTYGDGKNGCNFPDPTTLGVSVASKHGGRHRQPEHVDVRSCGDVKTLTVTPHALGSATIFRHADVEQHRRHLQPRACDVHRPRFRLRRTRRRRSPSPASRSARATPKGSVRRPRAMSPTPRTAFLVRGHAVRGDRPECGGRDRPADRFVLVHRRRRTDRCGERDLRHRRPERAGHLEHVSGTPGDNGWYMSDVSLVWLVTEGESPGSLVKTGCVDQSVTADQGARATRAPPRARAGRPAR